MHGVDTLNAPSGVTVAPLARIHASLVDKFRGATTAFT
jgi:hypothetical protein